MTQRYVGRGAFGEAAVRAPAPSLSSEDRERLLPLGRDLACAWDNSGTTIETRKKIIRLLIAEIIVDISNTLDLIIHWRGGDHTRLMVKKNKAGYNRCGMDADVIDLVRVLARLGPKLAPKVAKFMPILWRCIGSCWIECSSGTAAASICCMLAACYFTA